MKSYSLNLIATNIFLSLKLFLSIHDPFEILVISQSFSIILVCQANGVMGRVGMRDVYWKHIAEARKRLQETNPDASKKDVLNLARKECQPKFNPPAIMFNTNFYTHW